MKWLNVTYVNGERDLWYIPVNETLTEALKGIEKETNQTIQEYVLERGW